MASALTQLGPLHIAVLDDYQNAVKSLDAFSKLRDIFNVTIITESVQDVASLAARLKKIDVLVLIRERTAINDALLSQLPNLKLISQTGAGVAHIDLDACARHNVSVCVSSGNPYATAELTWALILSSARYVPQEINSARKGLWQTSPVGTRLYGRTLGIFGYGNIGRIVANYGRAFGMRVLVWGRAGSLTRAREDGFETASSKAELFTQSDVLSLHLKLSTETQGIITAFDLALMKRTAHLINTSRAALLESGALSEALQKGRPGFAAVDVYEAEPTTDDPLLSLSNALCSPHLGYVEKDTYEQFFSGAFDNILAFAKGEPANLILQAKN